MDEYENNEGGNRISRRTAWRGFWQVFIIFLVVFVGVSIFQARGEQASVMSQVGDECVGIAGASESYFVMYGDIISVEWMDHFDAGEKISGTENEKAFNGVYHNGAYGDYVLLAYKKIECRIVLTYTDGVIVFNNASEKATKETYEALLEKLQSVEG